MKICCHPVITESIQEPNRDGFMFGNAQTPSDFTAVQDNIGSNLQAGSQPSHQQQPPLFHPCPLGSLFLFLKPAPGCLWLSTFLLQNTHLLSHSHSSHPSCSSCSTFLFGQAQGQKCYCHVPQGRMSQPPPQGQQAMLRPVFATVGNKEFYSTTEKKVMSHRENVPAGYLPNPQGHILNCFIFLVSLLTVSSPMQIKAGKTPKPRMISLSF